MKSNAVFWANKKKKKNVCCGKTKVSIWFEFLKTFTYLLLFTFTTLNIKVVSGNFFTFFSPQNISLVPFMASHAGKKQVLNFKYHMQTCQTPEPESLRSLTSVCKLYLWIAVLKCKDTSLWICSLSAPRHLFCCRYFFWVGWTGGCCVLYYSGLVACQEKFVFGA